MQNYGNRIPRWVVENDPSWEKSIDSSLGILKWIKKGTGIQAICRPTSMFCDIVGQTDQAGLSDIFSIMQTHRLQAAEASGVNDIRKYLTSKYLNPDINGPRFDLRKFHRA
ncbi:MAG TPA: hypothetical protein VNI77_04115 [Nitrososphaera sp.]|nr:hypothetical protein [Nitrososphaera sp.]